MELQLYLRDMAEIQKISTVANTLHSELNYHFWKYTDPGDEYHEPIYMYTVSMILDPQYKPLINAVHTNGEQSESQRSSQSFLRCSHKRKKIL